MSRSVAISAFGRFSVLADGEDRTASFSPRARRCLAHLALRGEPVDRTILAAELWPDMPEAGALGSLRRRLHELRGAFECVGLNGAIERTRDKVALAPKAQWSIDVARYAILARDPAQAERAAVLYEEPVFPGLDDDALERARRTLRTAHMELLARLLETAIRRADAAAIAARANEILRLDPLSEQTIARAVAALEALGESDRARRLFARLTAEMREAFDVEPEPLDAGILPERSSLDVLHELAQRGEALRGAGAGSYFDAIEKQMPEIRSALDTAIVREYDVELGARALAALSRFFFDRGHVVEAYRWYEAVISRLPDSALRAETLYLRAMVGRNLGHSEHNLPAFEEAIAALRRSGDRTTLAKAMLYASNAARMTGRVALSEDMATQAHAILAASNDPYLLAFAHSALGAAAYARGRVADARRELEEAGRGFSALNANDDEALMLVNVGRCAFALGDDATALERLTRARERAAASGNVYVQGHAEVGLMLMAIERGDLQSARAHAKRAASLSLSGSDAELSVIALEACGELFLALGELARARDALAAADGVRSEFLIARAPTEHARSERVRAELAVAEMLVHGTVAAPDIMMRSLLESVARSYHIL